MTDQPAAEHDKKTEQTAEETAQQFNRDSVGEFMTYCGLQFVAVSDHRVEATWKAGPPLHQPYGIVHGGAHCAVIETLASVGGMVWFSAKEPTGKVVGVNNNTDFYKAVSEGELRSVATPIHRGRSQQVWLVETHDDQDRLIARGQVRLQNLT